jgi:hypothetical protein
MNRKSTVEALYRTGDFSNVKFVEETTEIPESIFLNKEIMTLIRQLQIVETEQGFNYFLQLSRITRSNSVREVMFILQEEGTSNDRLLEIEKMLEEYKTRTYDDLFKAIVSKQPTKEETKKE